MGLAVDEMESSENWQHSGPERQEGLSCHLVRWGGGWAVVGDRESRCKVLTCYIWDVLETLSGHLSGHTSDWDRWLAVWVWSSGRVWSWTTLPRELTAWWGGGQWNARTLRAGSALQKLGGTAAITGFPCYLNVEHSRETFRKPKLCKVKKRLSVIYLEKSSSISRLQK